MQELHGSLFERLCARVFVFLTGDYFETALDLTVCVSDKKNRFYLITIEGSQQAGLTGFKGGIVRKVAVDKTRSSLQKALAIYKQQIESQTE